MILPLSEPIRGLDGTLMAEIPVPKGTVVLVGVLVPTSGIAGSLLWPAIQRRTGWSNLRVVMTHVGLASLIPAYGCMGFLPIFQVPDVPGAGGGRWRFGGLTTPEEMYFLAVYFGESCTRGRDGG